MPRRGAPGASLARVDATWRSALGPLPSPRSPGPPRLRNIVRKLGGPDLRWGRIGGGLACLDGPIAGGPLAFRMSLSENRFPLFRDRRHARVYDGVNQKIVSRETNLGKG